MPNIQSAIKRTKTNKKAYEANRSLRSRIKRSLNQLALAVENNDSDLAHRLYTETFSLVDKAMDRKVFHPNNANRKKAKASHLINSLEA